MRVEIDDLIVGGDTVVLRFTLRGTDRGGYAGRPPTGRAVEEWGVNVMRFENDRVVSEFMGADKLGLPDPFPERYGSFAVHRRFRALVTSWCA